MEHKQLLFSAATLGLGIGLGVGLATGRSQASHRWNMLTPSSQSAHLLEVELLAQMIDGKESNVTFDEFPYYLNERTRLLLTNAAYVHLKQIQLTRFTRNLSPASRTLLLTGPAGAEAYHQMLAKAVAHFFNAKLLLLDVIDLSSKMQAKFGKLQAGYELVVSSQPSGVAAFNLLSRLFDSLQEYISFGQSFLAGDEKQSSFILNRWRERGSLETKVTKDYDAHLEKPAARRSNLWSFEDKSLADALYNVLSRTSQINPVVLYLRDVDGLLFKGPKTLSLFQKIFKKLSGPILILGSRLAEPSLQQVNGHLDAKLASLFPYNIDIKPPEDNEKLVNWKSQLEGDMKAIQIQDNRNHISEVLLANDVECSDMTSICFSDTVLLGKYIEEIVVSAISYHLMNTEDPQYHGGRLVISSSSLAHGLGLFQTGQLDAKDGKLQMESSPEQGSDENASKPEVQKESVASVKAEIEKTDSPKVDPPKKPDDLAKPTPASSSSKIPEVLPDNEFEKHIRPEVIPAGEVGVSFEDVGALEDVKEALQELVMLPLQRPELFSSGGLIKPCKGILLFGPPGTGKTMLAKAVATEAGASFINVSMSTITSKWFGEDEKNVRALFTLAAKVAPTVIFIDEVDSMLGQRSRVGEHEAMRKIKNEFMAHWDGLLTKPRERILVLAATNRPFDLDEAIVRRFERRIMVGLPNAENREKILRTILTKEKLADDFDFKDLAAITEGYSGSDLKNLCVTAAYRPIKELMKREEARKRTRDAVADNNQPSEQQQPIDPHMSETVLTDAAEAPDSCKKLALVQLRSLTMEDMRQAKNQVSPSFAVEGTGMLELQQWNDLFGEGGSRKKQQLTYFL